MIWILLLLGLGLLVLGAEWLVRGASRLSAALGISPLVIGLTVVAFGTSAPELAVSTVSAVEGHADVSLGNVVGSNIFNILLVLGVSAAIAPLTVSAQLIRLDVPVMVAVSILAWVLAWDGSIGRIDGGLLVLGIAAYTLFQVVQARREGVEVQQEFAAEYGRGNTSPIRRRTTDLALILAGLVLLVLGSRWLVDGAVRLAASLSVNQLVIGLTIVAAGTSLPELATSVVASFRGQRDIAVGNIVGSNLFNLLAVLGFSGLVSPEGIAVSGEVLCFDIPVMIATALACMPIFFTGSLIARWEGFLLLAFYIGYTTDMVLTASHSPAAFGFRVFLVGVAAPAAAVLLLAVTVQSLHGKREASREK